MTYSSAYAHEGCPYETCFSLSPGGCEKVFIMHSFSGPPRAEVRKVQRMINLPVR